MLAYDHTSAVHPWEQQLPDSSHEAYMQSLGPQAYAYAALGQSAHSMPSMDALQSMLLQSSGDQSAGQVDLSQLLAHLPTPPGLGQVPPGLSPAASSPQQLLHASSASSLQFDTTAADAWMHAAASAASSPTTGHPQEQLNSSTRLFVPDSLKAAGAVAGSSPPNQHQLLMQAALGQQQSSMADATNMLQEQLLLQATFQQQQAASAAQAQPNLQAALLAALSAGAAAPPGLGAPMPNSNAANMWPFMPPGLTDTTAATAAALLAAQQQQQQQAAMTRALASMSFAGGADPNALLQQALLAQQGFAAAPAAAGVLNQLQPWAVKALANQMQQQGAGGTLAGFNQLASLLNNTSAAGAGHMPRTASMGAQGRRRSGRRSSGTAAAAADLSGYGGFAAASRANSIAGSDMTDAKTSSGIPTVLPAGVSAKDLCPSKYEDTWASTDAPAAEAAAVPATATSISSDGSCQLARGSSSASTSSIESSATDTGTSVCGSALSLSSSGRQGSGAAGEDKWQWDSHFCSLEDDAVSQGSSGLSGRACRKAAAAAAAAAAEQDQVQQSDDTKASKDQTPANRKAAAAVAAAGCPVWLPSDREAAGDDSWYLPRPPTCRLFVGNIGCWVDEAMLLAYFGKYGHVVDVQVMWNTKMLARGRRVNREFAFISYSSPLEAARAVHWLDGCRLPDMEKDKNGVTVEYENGEGDIPAGK